MTPRDFGTAYMATARQVAAGTGLDPVVLLAQWGVETEWGAAVNNAYNLGNIRCVAGVPCVGGFAQFPNSAAFVRAAIDTWHNGYYPAVLASVGSGPKAQMLAIGASPWDAGHYTGKPPYNYAGGSLVAAYMEVRMFPIQARRAIIASWWLLLYGVAVTDEATLANWAGTLKDDGTNWDSVFAQLGATPAALTWRAHLLTAAAGGLTPHDHEVSLPGATYTTQGATFPTGPAERTA